MFIFQCFPRWRGHLDSNNLHFQKIENFRWKQSLVQVLFLALPFDAPAAMSTEPSGAVQGSGTSPMETCKQRPTLLLGFGADVI